MGAADAFGKLPEEWIDNLFELLRLDDVEDLFNLPKEHYLLKISFHYFISYNKTLLLHVRGQNFNKLSKTWGVSDESFSMNWTTQ